MTYTLITDNQHLIEACHTDATVLALDTEFIRTRTFYAKPGLYQLFDGQNTLLIDPIAVSDLSPLWRLLHDPKRVSILHSGSEDIELLHQQSGAIPAQVHDTQLAAAFLGLGSQLGFAPLVEKLLGVSLDKAHSRTDWLARPLSNEQLNYAADDVIYLYPLYQKLMEQLAEKGLTEWFEQECTRVAHKRVQAVDPNLVYQDMKYAWTLDRQGLAILQALCAWRLTEARRRDLAINFVVKEAHLLRIAERAPKTMDDLAKLELAPMEIRRHGTTLLKLVQAALADPERWPQPVTRLIDYPDYKAELSRIRSLINATGEQAGIPGDVIASKRMIHQYLSWKWRFNESEHMTPTLLTGWRKELLGTKL
ncbi:ribonuclease D [Oceanisphaera pacifica]|uniref:Ribonuclease D n=1 Tax=Oceanisphaera pacifica TaxID=2818389 RepID=A0ABS3NFR0_9GAMM|nr:ribonuclease D [Oceanisphaera pacifica]MBO1519419.1 ribonuclease D [Oceanisphaera pacifica]